MSVYEVEIFVNDLLNELMDIIIENVSKKNVTIAKNKTDATTTPRVNRQALMVYDAKGNARRQLFTGDIANPDLGPRPVLRLMVDLPTMRVFNNDIDLIKSFTSSTREDVNFSPVTPPKGGVGISSVEYNVIPDYTDSDDITLPSFVIKSKRLRLYESDLFTSKDIGQVSIVSELALMVCQLAAENDFIREFHTTVIEYYQKEYGRHFTPKPLTTSELLSKCFWQSLSFLSKLNRRSVFGMVMLNRLLEKFCKAYIVKHHICHNCGKKMKIGERIQCCGMYAHARKILEHEHLKLCALRDEFERLRYQFKTEMKMEILRVEYIKYHDIIRKLINVLNDTKPDFLNLGLLDKHKIFFYNEYTLQMKRLYHYLRELDETMKMNILVGPPKERVYFANVIIDCPPFYKFLGPNSCAYKNVNMPLLSTDFEAYNVHEATNAANYNLADAINPDVLNCWVTNLETFIKIDMQLKSIYNEAQQVIQNECDDNEYYENNCCDSDNDGLIVLHFDENFEF